VQQFEPRFSLAHTRLFPHLELEGGVRPSDLALATDMSKQAVNQLLNDLESIEAVRREPDPSDGRAKLVFLTEHGRELMLRGLGVFKEVEKEISDAVSPKSVEATKASLHDLLTFLEEH
jgi:DNA-binding MarR family transcriptional regulator